jgi:chromosome segregation ATPase
MRKKSLPRLMNKQLQKSAAQTEALKQDKETAILREIKEMQMEIENLKTTILSETNVRTLEEDLCREFQHLKKEVKESVEKNRHTVDKMEGDIKFIKEDIGKIMSLEEEMSRINAKSVTRDIESLKAKSHWLETNMKGFNIDPIIEKIQEIEDNIKIMKASQPLILE